MKARARKRTKRILITIKRLRQSTSATLSMVQDYVKTHKYEPLAQRSNFVKFVNDTFVNSWLRRHIFERPRLP